MTNRERNRAEAAAHGMGCVAEWVDVLRAGGFERAAPAFIEAPDGWTAGKRDRTGEVDGLAMVRAADAHARWFGGGVVSRQPAPRKRAMTQSQRECLEGQP